VNITAGTSPARHRVGRSRVWSLGPPLLVSRPAPATSGSLKAKDGRRARRFYRCWQDQIFLRDSINGQSFYTKARIRSSQLCPVRFRFLSTGRSGSFHMEQLPVADCHLHHGGFVWRYHAANSLFKHPTSSNAASPCPAYTTCGTSWTHVRRQFLLQQSVDYLSNASDPWFYEQIASCDIHITTVLVVGKQRTTYALEVLSSKGFAIRLDNWARRADMTGPTGSTRCTNIFTSLLRFCASIPILCRCLSNSRLASF